MFALFKNHNPFAVIALFILTILTRIVYLTSFEGIITHDGQLIWSHLTANMQQSFGEGSLLLFFLMIINIFGQAIYLNRISSQFDLFPKASYLPAYTYILLSALLPIWNNWTMHSVLIWFVLLLIQSILKLYNTKDGKKEIFNVGLIIGLIGIISVPSSLFLFVGLLGMIILRPFKATEFFSFLLGIATPYYLLFGIAYLTNQLQLIPQVFVFDTDLVQRLNTKEIISFSFLALLLLPSLMFASQMINRMLIEYKKYWNVILLTFIFSIIVAGASMSGNLASISLLLPCMVLFFNFNYFEQFKKWYSSLASLIVLAGVITIQWINI